MGDHRAVVEAGGLTFEFRPKGSVTDDHKGHVAGVPQRLADALDAPVINAGDGAHEHPTQALLDMLTVRQEKGRIEGLTIAIIGDITHSRVARSNIHGFTKLGAEVRVAGPPTMLPSGIEALGVKAYTSLREVLEGADVPDDYVPPEVSEVKPALLHFGYVDERRRSIIEALRAGGVPVDVLTEPLYGYDLAREVLGHAAVLGINTSPDLVSNRVQTVLAMGGRMLQELPAEGRAKTIPGVFCWHDCVCWWSETPAPWAEWLVGRIEEHYWPAGVSGENLPRHRWRDRVAEALADAQLSGFEDRDPATLSGGQRARISVLRTLLAEPKALLLDEPFSRLDQSLRGQFRRFVFDHARARALPVLLVSHDPADANAAGGVVIEIDPVREEVAADVNEVPNLGAGSIR